MGDLVTDEPRWYTKVGETLPSRRDGIAEPNVYERGFATGGNAMGDRLKIHLFTRDGGFVHAAEIPPFLVPPEVVQWGARVFVLEKSGGPTAPCEYAEGLLYPLLEGVTSHDAVISRSVVRRLTAQQPGVYDAITAARAEAAEAALVAARRDEAKLRQHFDAFGEGQEASLQGKPRASNPYPPGDSYGVGTDWVMWDDGYDCNINRQLKAQLAAAEARVQQLEAALATQEPTHGD